MSTPTQTQDDTERDELLALIALAALQLRRAWDILTLAQHRLLRRLQGVRPGRGATASTRTAIRDFLGQVAEYDRRARALAERWAAADLPTAYRDGALQALRRAEASVELFQWSVDHQAAITALTATYYADLVRRILEAVRRAHAFARDAQAAARTHAGVDAAALLQAHPLHTVIYANQARHPVESWARAALSWQGVVTANMGAINTSRLELGVEWMEVADGPECGWQTHDDHDQANGTIRSIDDCVEFPSAHHGCIRQFFPRPDLNGRTDITSGDPV